MVLSNIKEYTLNFFLFVGKNSSDESSDEFEESEEESSEEEVEEEPEKVPEFKQPIEPVERKRKLVEIDDENDNG